ncbi:hypothetical protein BCD64_10630 [Nostoc sp. MBR 210]|nr:hypothetical protein BCD64_10630 [Nostoc sp. MBR 210]
MTRHSDRLIDLTHLRKITRQNRFRLQKKIKKFDFSEQKSNFLINMVGMLFKGLPNKKTYNFSCGVDILSAPSQGRARSPPHKIG